MDPYLRGGSRLRQWPFYDGRASQALSEAPRTRTDGNRCTEACKASCGAVMSPAPWSTGYPAGMYASFTQRTRTSKERQPEPCGAGTTKKSSEPRQADGPEIGSQRRPR